MSGISSTVTSSPAEPSAGSAAVPFGMPEPDFRDLLLDGVAEGVLLVNREWKVAFANGKAREILSRFQTALLRPGETDLREGFPAELEERCRTALREQRAEVFEIAGEAPGLWLEARVAPAAGGLAVYLRDVSERRLAELERDSQRSRAEALDARLERETARQSAAAEANARLYEEGRQTAERLRHELAVSYAVSVSLGEGVLTVDREGRVSFINPAGAEMLGWSIRELLGRPVHETIHHHHADGNVYPGERCPLLRVAHSGETLRTENEVFWRRDGTFFPVACTAAPVRSGGEITGVAMVFSDISRRRREEEAQAERAGLSALRSEIALILAGGADLKKVLRQCAAALERHLPNTFVRIHTREEPQEQGEPAEPDGNGGSTGRITLKRVPLSPREPKADSGSEFVLRPEDGPPAGAGTAAFAGYPLVIEGRTVGMVAVYARDSLTEAVRQELKTVSGSIAQCIERKRAGAALAAHGRRTELLSRVSARLLMTETPDRLLDALFQKMARELSAEIYLHYGIAEEDGPLVLARSGGLARPEHPAFARLRQGEGVCGSAALRQEPVIVPHVQESAFPGIDALRRLGVRACMCHPLIARGRLLGTLTFASTSRESFEEEEAGFLRTVADLVAVSLERNRLLTELSASRDAAEQASRAKDEFLATLSHELRTPLNPVLLLASEGAEDPALPREVRGDFLTIRKNVELEARLIDDLLDLTRITRGKLTLNLRVHDAHTVLRDALANVRAEAEQRHIRLETRLAPGAPRVRCDAVRLQQVFWNVLRNAVKFSHPGGVVTVVTRTDEAAGTLSVSVSDRGIGMTEEELARVFEIFTQGNHAGGGGSHRFGGVGLGMAIARKLMERQNGSIRATSPGPGLGSEFTVELPLARPDEESGPPAESAH